MQRIATGLLAALAISLAGHAFAASPFKNWDREPVRIVAKRVVENLERRGEWLYYNGYRGVEEYRAGHRLFRGYWFPAQAFLDGGIATGAIGEHND